jgi:aldose 1-epimerase
MNFKLRYFLFLCFVVFLVACANNVCACNTLLRLPSAFQNNPERLTNESRYEQLIKSLVLCGQESLLDGWGAMEEKERNGLLDDIERINLAGVLNSIKEINDKPGGHKVTLFSKQGYVVLRLADLEKEISFDIVPGRGNTILSLKVKGEEILFETADMKKPRGIPFMTPPNRIKDGKVIIDGKLIDLTKIDILTGDGQGNLQHGMLRYLPWKIEKIAVGEKGIFIESSIDTSDTSIHADIGAFGKAEHKLIYGIQEKRLCKEIQVTNKDTKPMLWGGAWHEWLKAENPEDVRVVLPGRKYCESDKLVPNGKLRDAVEVGLEPGKVVSVAGQEEKYNHVLTDLALDENGWATSLFYNKKEGTLVKIRQDVKGSLKYLVFYVTKGAVCIEAQSCMTDAHNLKARGIDSGLIEIKQGKTISLKSAIEVENIGPGKTSKTLRTLFKKSATSNML